MKTLALFDLDNTLIRGDSDFLWGVFLTKKKYVDQTFQKKHLAYLNDYQSGVLDIDEFLRFTLTPLTQFSKTQLAKMHEQFMEEKIKPIIRPQARGWITSHQQKDHTIAMITATNEFITQPIAKYFGIKHLMATCIQQKNGQLTNRVKGVPCFQAGKIEHLQTWMKKQRQRFDTTFFYSDSFNDQPLLEWVTHPIAVTPDEKLKKHAKLMGWKILES